MKATVQTQTALVSAGAMESIVALGTPRLSSCLYVKTRVLTDLERRRIGEYLKADGEREKDIQNLVYRTRKYLPTIRQDTDLLEKLVKRYDAQKTR